MISDEDMLRGGREGERKGGRDGREEGREGGREEGKEGGRKGRREGGREGGREVREKGGKGKKRETENEREETLIKQWKINTVPVIKTSFYIHKTIKYYYYLSNMYNEHVHMYLLVVSISING